MQRISLSFSGIVIDANIAVWNVLPTLATVDAAACIADWRQRGRPLWAPTLWVAEAVSAIRANVYARTISEDQAQRAIDDLFALEVELFPMGIEQCRSALDWAGRLQQAKAYDGFYLALAESLSAEFWTADRRLANAAAQLGTTWVHWIGEMATGS